MIVNPAPGALVRDPATNLAIDDGAEIDPNEPYFARLLADGDLAPEAVTREAAARAESDAGTSARIDRVSPDATPPSEDAA